MEKEIKVYVFEGERKADKVKFNYFRTKFEDKDGKTIWANIKFTKAVKDLPTENCIAVVDSSKINKDKKNPYLTYWVQEVKEFKYYPKKEDKVELDDEDLPF